MSDDLISRSALIEKFSKNSIFSRITNAEGKNVLEIIQEIPTVQTVDKESCNPVTNGDWVRGLNNSELAEFIEEIECESANCGSLLTSKYVPIEDMSGTVLEWLEEGRRENE